MKEIRDMLLQAPDSQLDACMKPYIQKWSDEPTSLQVLEVIDHCVFGGLASGFTMNVLHTIYNTRLKEEGKTHEDNVPYATWRDE